MLYYLLLKKNGIKYWIFIGFFYYFVGESVEENVNLVVRFLIRRLECLGFVLRGEGGGLLKVIKDGIRMFE